MVDAVLTWLFGVNPLVIWLVGGLICWAAYLVAVPDSDDPRQNRDRAMVAGAMLIIWPSVLVWLGPVLLVVWLADRIDRWGRGR